MGREIEVEDATEHHRRAWRVKRVAWSILALIVVAGLAGALGPGPLSKAAQDGPGHMRLEYQRIARYNAPTFFHLHVPSGAQPVEVSINADFIKEIDVESIQPEPTEMRLDGERHTWVFARSKASSDSLILISFRPQSYGATPASIEVRGLGSITVKPFFLP